MQTGGPGVFIEDIRASARPIEGVGTSTTAFVGATASGPVAAPVLVHSFMEFEAQFGGLSADMPLGYAVRHYLLNGGRDALIARVVPTGPALTDADISSPALEPQQRGLWLLDHTERFDMLCIPPLSRTSDVGRATWDAATAYAVRRRAMVIVDPPATWTAARDISESAIAARVSRSANAALYFPRIRASDPLDGDQVADFAPCGAVAGIYARIDAARGLWQAPAGAEASVLGAQGLSAALTTADLSVLNEVSVNALRALPGGAIALWGARTLADAQEPQLRYVPVRRLAMFIEASVARWVQLAVFEPNGEPLWAKARERITNFLHGLFLQRAFQGRVPNEAYFVRCDASTMTQQDIDEGRLVAIVGFAPLKPAEFVTITIRQIVGGTSTDRPPH
jgi:phage tail sheath protein FI